MDFNEPFAIELCKKNRLRARSDDDPLPPIQRTTTVDAYIGDGLFRIVAYTHAEIALIDGYEPVKSEVTNEHSRRYQVGFVNGKCSGVLFSPCGPNVDYFKYYIARINSAGFRRPAVARFENDSFPIGISLFVCDLSRINLKRADLVGVNLKKTCLKKAYLVGANLVGANLTETNLTEISLSEANLTAAILFRANLKKANLREANLREANLVGADLVGADLVGAVLRGANLRGAYLRGAYLTGADLRDADFRGADLSEANLSGANLSGANFTNANLSKTNITGTFIEKTKFSAKQQSMVIDKHKKSKNDI